MEEKKKILFGVLNWGLGHATRSWELINKYVLDGHEVVLASDGVAAEFLSTEFPLLKIVSLPGYNIKYGKGAGLLQMLFNALRTNRAVVAEKKFLDDYLSKNEFDLIVSDNRYGLFSDSVKSIIITHQLNIKVPFGSKAVNWQNHKWLNRFAEVWVPDTNAELSGELTHPIPYGINKPVKEIGLLSRFKNLNQTKGKEIDVLAIVSGPEPQKTVLVKKLQQIFEESHYKTVIYTGDVKLRKTIKRGNLTIKSHAETNEFYKDLLTAKVVIGRSGYSSLMDYSVMKKSFITIPTPGQDEQLYLAKMLSKKGIPVLLQSELSKEKVDKAIQKAQLYNSTK